ncbi:choice-of-anchor tandem repeat GloVer-containing protein [Haloferula sp.]|uniref:choice-of-anchor tandem repeat GloVer-containing protein n=1 Tax=Haloferula sp. TaxID=2497595 RepID=UPI0032A06DCD
MFVLAAEGGRIRGLDELAQEDWVDIQNPRMAYIGRIVSCRQLTSISLVRWIERLRSADMDRPHRLLHRTQLPLYRILRTVAMVLALSSSASSQVIEEIFNFRDARVADLADANNKGRSPRSAMIQGSDGNFYGTTQYGGATGLGTVFRMTPTGVLTTLVEFTDNGASNKGGSPSAALVQGSDGDFYGTTQSGGAAGFGTVFRMTPTGVLTTLVEFTDNGASNKGRLPLAALVQGSDGDFYGTTRGAGPFDHGTVFKMTSAGVLTTLVEFTNNGASNKGRFPRAALVQGNDGSFYGSTEIGGEFNYGTIFKMTSAGVLTTLVEFTDNGAGNKGRSPSAGLVQGGDGNFYGTTQSGGATGSGTVFRVTPTGVLTTLVEFTGNGSNNKGSTPSAALVQGSDGVFYGTTVNGSTLGHGTIFKTSSAGVLNTLVTFVGDGLSNVGNNPLAGLIQGSDGDFYGTTNKGGTLNFGTIFKMTPAGVLSPLVEFTDNGASNKGKFPHASLVQGSDGDFYGMTQFGGASNYGTIFKMTSGGVLTTLVEFTDNGASNKGRGPEALVQGSDGNFYGTTRIGGALGYGTIFKMTSAGVLTTLVEFTDNGASNKGMWPEGALVQGSDGNFYGTTRIGGTFDHGTVFKMTSAGVLTTLVEFTDNGASNKGKWPEAALVQGNDGDFYGTTSRGGTLDHGTIFKTTSAGVLTTLVEFTDNGASNKGRSPSAALVQGSDGDFYGTTQSGGAYDSGTLFKMTPTGVMTTLMEFTEANSLPRGSLCEAADGSLYGITQASDGTIYRLRFPGKPTLSPLAPVVQGGNNAQIQAEVNANGSATDVTFEYSTNSKFFDSMAVAQNLTGFQSTLVRATLSDLPPGVRYFCRFRAVSEEGETVSPIQNFRTAVANDGFANARPVNITSGSISLVDTNVGATSEVGEVTYEGLATPGKSVWYRITVPAGSYLSISTEGSSFDTVLSVFRQTSTGLAGLEALYGNDNADEGGTFSRLDFVGDEIGGEYFISVAGSDSSSGTIALSFTTIATESDTMVYQRVSGNSGSIGPRASLMQGSDGNFYGTNGVGGTEGFGKVFKMSPGGWSKTLTDFTGVSKTAGTPWIFSNATSIEINDNASATPYPSTITVPDRFNTIGNVRVTLRGFTHTYPSDVRVLLVSPSGTACLLMSNPLTDRSTFNATLTFDDDATEFVGSISGTRSYLPTPRNGAGQDMRPNAPAAPYGGQLSVFDGEFPEGDWKLYVEDGSGGASGRILGGWSLEITEPTPHRGAGSSPAGLLEAFNGTYFYGTTSGGGASNQGTVFKVTPDGVLTTLAEFTGTPTMFNNDAPMAFNDDAIATPYPSIIDVPVGVEEIQHVRVTLRHFTHPDPEDMTFLLVSPSGTTCLLMSGGSYDSDCNYCLEDDITTFDDDAATEADPAGSLSGIYKPSAFDGADPNMDSPAPDGPYGTSLSVFDGEQGVGVWSLYIQDRSNEGPGTLAGGWSLEINPAPSEIDTKSALVQGSLGFYGTTSSGGVNGLGSIFRLRNNNTLETLVSFTGNGGSNPGSSPRAALVRDSDGNFYGTTFTGGTNDLGTIFRFTPGEALETLINFTGNGASNKGSLPLGSLMQGSDGNFYGTTSTGGTNGHGTLFRLIPGQALETLVHFTGDGASNKGSNPSADLIQDSDGKFYGTTRKGGSNNQGTAFSFVPGEELHTLHDFLETPVGPLFMAADGLPYGITDSGTIFRIIAPEAPKLFTRDPRFLSDSRVWLQTDIDVSGSAASVILEYGTDGVNFPHVASVGSGEVNAISKTNVGVEVSDWNPASTYYYRFRATNIAGTTVGEVQSLTTCSAESPFECLVGAHPGAQGSILVTIEPSGIGGWRFEGEKSWRPSGIPVGGLARGVRSIHFRPVAGYLQPPSETVFVDNSLIPSIERNYYETTAGSASLTITLKPDSIAQGSNRAQWRLLGEDDGPWRDSGTTLGGLVPGSYLIECKPVAGRNTPQPNSVLIEESAITARTITYFIADTTAGTPPAPVPPETATDYTNSHSFVGQIRSNAGNGSGFVVRNSVVATAAHVIFDDSTLSGYTDLQWLEQRDAGTYEPEPLIPRGTFIFTDYAARRATEATPGSLAQESQNMDVGVLYFAESDLVGWYGFSIPSLLVSEMTENEFLGSSANKILIGYPNNDVPPSNQGRMHATPPANATFTRVFDQTYITPGIRGSDLTSGGPLCVQRPDGYYYPAAIHVGGSSQTTVRAIDSGITALFTWAENAALGNGDNPPSGGPTMTGVTGSILPSDFGEIMVTIEPPAARASGAAWQLSPSNPDTHPIPSGNRKSRLAPGSYSLKFRTIPGFATPDTQMVAVNKSQLTSVTVTYQVSLSPLDIWRQEHFQTTLNSGDAADSGDPDKDGRNNIDEFAAGTDPNDSTDFFRVSTATKTGSTFTAGCAGKASRVYTLERSADLDGIWDPIASQGPLVSDGAVSLTDPSAPVGTSFYRIVVSSP